MSGLTLFFDKSAKIVAIVVAAVFSISSAAAGATCGICDTEIVINSELASCFLEQYDQLASRPPSLGAGRPRCPAGGYGGGGVADAGAHLA